MINTGSPLLLACRQTYHEAIHLGSSVKYLELTDPYLHVTGLDRLPEAQLKSIVTMTFKGPVFAPKLNSLWFAIFFHGGLGGQVFFENACPALKTIILDCQLRKRTPDDEAQDITNRFKRQGLDVEVRVTDRCRYASVRRCPPSFTSAITDVVKGTEDHPTSGGLACAGDGG